MIHFYGLLVFQRLSQMEIDELEVQQYKEQLQQKLVQNRRSSKKHIKHQTPKIFSKDVLILGSIITLMSCVFAWLIEKQ